MRKVARMLAATCLVGTLLIPPSANAVIASYCTASYVANGSCVFYLAGGYLSVEGTSTNQTQVTVRVVGPLGQTLAICSGSGSCFSQTGVALTDPFIDLPAGVPLTCQVTGTSGTFRCYSIL